MVAFIKQMVTRGMIGGMIVVLLFGCATVKEMEFNQKYENSKSWFKKKWHTMEAKFSSDDAEPSALEPYPKNSKYVVYQTQWAHETLPGIAEWFTGDSENWRQLAHANPKLNPERIPANTPILIPAKLVKKKTPPTEAFAAKHRVHYFVHQVRWRGETLSLIAKWYTGHYGNWKALAKANPDLNPNHIVLGHRIQIPPEMMKTRKRLPRKVVARTLPGYFAHTVTQTDEKLSDIAKWYTGSASNKKAIAAANPDIDPEFLLVGNEIYIPSTLRLTTQPMDQRSKKTAKVTEKLSQPEAVPSAPKQKKIMLFGPKQFQAD
ncbi:MAG: LysM domain-containing protein [Desulfobacterales bacterium]|jgi:hypothetical protein